MGGPGGPARAMAKLMGKARWVNVMRGILRVGICVLCVLWDVLWDVLCCVLCVLCAVRAFCGVRWSPVCAGCGVWPYSMGCFRVITFAYTSTMVYGLDV